MAYTGVASPVTVPTKAALRSESRISASGNSPTISLSTRPYLTKSGGCSFAMVPGGGRGGDRASTGLLDMLRTRRGLDLRAAPLTVSRPAAKSLPPCPGTATFRRPAVVTNKRTARLASAIEDGAAKCEAAQEAG